MSFWSSITDKISGAIPTKWFTSEEDVQTAHDVADAQQVIVDRQYDEGVISDEEYYGLSGDIQDAGQGLDDATLDAQDEARGNKLIEPWMIWTAAFVLAIYLLGKGGFFNGLGAKLIKRK